MKKIINTIQGVLVSWSWKITDVLREMMNSIDFIVHHKQNRIEMEDFEKEVAGKNREIKVLESINKDKDKKYQELLQIHTKDKSRISNLEINNVTKTNRITVLEDRLQDVNNQYIEVFHNYTNTSVKCDKLQESFNKLRGKIGGLQKENNRLKIENDELTIKLVSAREELLKTKNKNKFLESKLPKKTLEEITAYTFSQKEVLKRSKKNEK